MENRKQPQEFIFTFGVLVITSACFSEWIKMMNKPDLDIDSIIEQLLSVKDTAGKQVTSLKL